MSTAIHQQAAARAAEERKRLALGAEPIADVRSLVEQQGALVYSTSVPGGSLSGCFALVSGESWILVNTAQTVGRQRFTIAHEYCHSLVDRKREFVICTSEKPPHEKYADAFAAAFLMPPESTLAFFSAALKSGVSPSGVVDYCYAFGVSFQAAAYRLADLSVLTTKRRDALLAESPRRLASAQGYDVQDPASPFFMADDECRPSIEAFPKAYRSASIEAHEKGLISDAKLAELLGVDADDLDDLLDPIEVVDVPVAW
jgi:Zn-dependent peptidase ImmA (M78 family)